LSFQGAPIEVEANAALPVPRFGTREFGAQTFAAVSGRLSSPLLAPSAPKANCGGEIPEPPEPDAPEPKAPQLGLLRPLGQIRNSFILAVNDEGLWIIDQHVAHERVLFEKVLRQRAARGLEGQRMLMPMIVELTPAQQAVFSEINDELAHNGFEIEPFGSRTVAVKTAPAGIEAGDVERMLHELLEQFAREEQAINLETARAEIAASIACHAAIKVNTPLEPDKMEWLLRELAQTECPMSCPHGRPVVLRYSVKEIQRAFKRI
jgi:DNA mismatch repair protein MutL